MWRSRSATPIRVAEQLGHNGKEMVPANLRVSKPFPLVRDLPPAHRGGSRPPHAAAFSAGSMSAARTRLPSPLFRASVIRISGKSCQSCSDYSADTHFEDLAIKL